MLRGDINVAADDADADDCPAPEWDGTCSMGMDGRDWAMAVPVSTPNSWTSLASPVARVLRALGLRRADKAAADVISPL
jgi:hypothetical protein